jgi:hypothetical protein
MLASPPELGIDVSAHAGLGLREQSDGDGIDLGLAYGVSGGYDIGQLLGDLPLRAELALLSDTFGGGRGVRAVDVDSWQGELMALAGLDWLALPQGLRLQLLAGGGLRVTWVRIQVQGQSDTTWSAAAFAGLVGGVAWDLGPASVGVRAMWGLPRPRLAQVYAFGTWRL